MATNNDPSAPPVQKTKRGRPGRRVDRKAAAAWFRHLREAAGRQDADWPPCERAIDLGFLVAEKR